jgi:hypothetical protein
MTAETVPMQGRIYLTIAPGTDGKMQLSLSRLPPSTKGALAALISRGVLLGGELSMAVDLVSNPKADPDLKGETGPNGWTPMLAGEADGTRTLLRVVDWTGGKGTKPALGYLGPAGSTALVAKAAAFNFNALKRVDIFTAQTDASGVASIVFDPAFSTVPAKALPTAIPNVLAGPIKAELVAGSLAKTGCKVKVTQQSLVGGLITALAGATVNVIAIEA